LLDKPPIPPQIADLLAPLWVWVVSVLGAVVGYLQDFHAEDTWPVRLLKAAVRLSSSALAAVLTYHALLAMEVPSGWHVVLVGIAGHMGVEALRVMGNVWAAKAGK
jgi:D-arabinose 1-dehydrogenase-like Zn-dependent alcohol dehydrogenase